jgi:hypothetical protein
VTRDALRPLEGQLVWFSGRLSTWKTQANGRLSACLTTVNIRPWDGEAAISDCPVTTTVDHVWICDIPDSWPRERLRRYVAIGRVGWYRRADGTVDLGVSQVPSLDLGWCAQQLQDVHDLAVRLESIDGLLAQLDGGTTSYAWWTPRSVAITQIRRARDLLEASQTATFIAMARSTRKGPCRGLDPVPLRRRKPRTRAIAGFA